MGVALLGRGCVMAQVLNFATERSARRQSGAGGGTRLSACGRADPGAWRRAAWAAEPGGRSVLGAGGRAAGGHPDFVGPLSVEVR